MNNNKTFIKECPSRQVWVKREDGSFEYKPWFIYEVIFSEQAQKKLSDFLEYEEKRLSGVDIKQLSPNVLQVASKLYGDLNTNSTTLPIRLLSIPFEELIALPTELVDRDFYTLGDSVGGIAPNKEQVHNAHFEELALSQNKEILFTPGVLCLLPIKKQDKQVYLFQLAEKNLRNKGKIFYKPIGGHLKYKEKFLKYLNVYSLRVKSSLKPQDINDLALFIAPEKFKEFVTFFHNTIHDDKENLFMSIADIVAKEIEEEIGPKDVSDGISLLTESELGQYASMHS